LKFLVEFLERKGSLSNKKRRERKERGGEHILLHSQNYS